uniref:glutathione transferase n=1 Tax=Saccoglossus kowalevskii TaxID=10224 RepID=A0ABM0LZC2_SACKO|nr:PREDICTED: glutathione S-transferase-like [Saccoglossus kowalevskii]
MNAYVKYRIIVSGLLHHFAQEYCTFFSVKAAHSVEEVGKKTQSVLFLQQWLTKKFPFSRLPILEVDGVTIGEGQAIARFLARRHGLYADDVFDQAKIDMITDTIKDIFEKLAETVLAEKEKKQELMDKYFKDVFPLLLQGLERVLKENNGGDGYFVGDKVTLADLAFIDSCYSMVELKPEVLTDYPKLNALKQRVESRPRIAEWMEKRPVYVF